MRPITFRGKEQFQFVVGDAQESVERRAEIERLIAGESSAGTGTKAPM